MRARNGNTAALRIALALGLATAGAVLLGQGNRAAESELGADLELPSLWVRSIEPRAWVGYNDNVLLGNRTIEKSSFLAGGLDLTFFRLPANGWEYMFLSSAEYLRYFSAPTVDYEANALVEGQVHKAINAEWKAGVTADYGYFNQVIDSSAYTEVFQPVQVEGNTFSLRPSVARDLGNSYQLELELPATRQIFNQVIDGYWEFGPKLILKREWGRQSEISAFYEFGERVHDTRQALDNGGQIELGNALRFFRHEWAVAWRQYWDEKRFWRTVTKVSLQRNEDNGGGYYDYWRPQWSEQVRYQAKTWSVRADAKVSYYHYDLQPISTPGSAVREKTFLHLTLRGEKTLSKSLKLFAQYEYEESISNLDLDRFTANIFSAGLNWEF